MLTDQALTDSFHQTAYGNRRRRMPYVLAGRQALAILLLTLATTRGLGQVGRGYVSVEAYIGLARTVHVGKIIKLEQIDYKPKKPLTRIQKLGLAKPYRIIFEVNETVRGKHAERLEIVLSLQSSHELECMQDLSAEIMLVAGPNHIDSSPRPRVGIEEQGVRVDGEWYQFRLLNPIEVPKSGRWSEIGSMVNRSYDSCRMFTQELDVVDGREAILKAAREFAKDHTEMLTAVNLHVPNAFGALCGTPNAYSMIVLPNCPSTRKMLNSLKKNPDRVMKRIPPRLAKYYGTATQSSLDFERSVMLTSVDKALAIITTSGEEHSSATAEKNSPSVKP